MEYSCFETNFTDNISNNTSLNLNINSKFKSYSMLRKRIKVLFQGFKSTGSANVQNRLVQ